MGESWEKLPQAYWKKSVHGSAEVSMICLSRLGKSSGGFSGPGLLAADGWAIEPADKADATTSAVMIFFIIRFFLRDYYRARGRQTNPSVRRAWREFVSRSIKNIGPGALVRGA